MRFWPIIGIFISLSIVMTISFASEKTFELKNNELIAFQFVAYWTCPGDDAPKFLRDMTTLNFESYLKNNNITYEVGYFGRYKFFEFQYSELQVILWDDGIIETRKMCDNSTSYSDDTDRLHCIDLLSTTTKQKSVIKFISEFTNSLCKPASDISNFEYFTKTFPSKSTTYVYTSNDDGKCRSKNPIHGHVLVDNIFLIPSTAFIDKTFYLSYGGLNRSSDIPAAMEFKTNYFYGEIKDQTVLNFYPDDIVFYSYYLDSLKRFKNVEEASYSIQFYNTYVDSLYRNFTEFQKTKNDWDFFKNYKKMNAYRANISDIKYNINIMKEKNSQNMRAMNNNLYPMPLYLNKTFAAPYFMLSIDFESDNALKTVLSSRMQTPYNFFSEKDPSELANALYDDINSTADSLNLFYAVVIAVISLVVSILSTVVSVLLTLAAPIKKFLDWLNFRWWVAKHRLMRWLCRLIGRIRQNGIIKLRNRPKVV